MLCECALQLDAAFALLGGQLIIFSVTWENHASSVSIWFFTT
jgi:hypothetical protein